MSAQVAPTVPPRPTRAQQAAANSGVSKLPDIPPRPAHSRLERSISPRNFPRSPLNEPWTGNLMRQKTNEQASTDLMPRRPSVQNLPSLGQEGMEYGEIMDSQTKPQPSASTLDPETAAQTRNIAHDLKLHAPKPSLPVSSATAQVQAVTRTDSSQAAQHGLGKSITPSLDEGESLQRVRTRTSFSRPSSTADSERRLSIHGEETGPAELGLRVPINPLLGDVQAPSPAVGLSPHNTGNNGDRKRSGHSRTRSSRDFNPPGSYGLHGHGLVAQDRFEKDWYAKHPEAAQFEETHGHGVYESIGSGRGSFALSSDDLNKIVRQTASRGAGLGTSAATPSYPDEQIGYAASEVFVSRSQANTPNSLAKTLTNTSQPAVESPLRKASFPADGTVAAEVRRGRRSVSGRTDDHAIDSEQEQEVHIEPLHRYNKITGGEEPINETERTRPSVSYSADEDDYINEHGYSVPILAADEVAKEVGIEHLQPAVSPKAERRGSAYELERSGDATPSSRPSSRPSSVYGLHSATTSLSRFVSHHDDRENMSTPLEDVEEYEPLFPEDDDENKPLNHAERFKQRPNALKQRFPSQDIWEDPPSSHFHSAEVSTPDLISQAAKQTSKEFESPEQEAARKEEVSEEERKKLIPQEQRLAKSRFAPHLRDDMPTRPGMVPRFPSSDIWEDSPESHQLVTTVSSTPVDDRAEDESPVKSTPILGKSRLGEDASRAQVAPSIPARPQKHVQAGADGATLNTSVAKSTSTSPTELKKVPSIPDRPKPQVPARPAKKLTGDSLTKTTSGEASATPSQEKTSPPVAKAKPQVPVKPGAGSKIASLRGNFMNDLNQKLGLGPPKEKEPEPVVEETKPLEDARKGRARGPQRRAPAKSPAAPVKSVRFAISQPRSMWTIDDTDEVRLASEEDSAPESTSKLEDAPVEAGVSSEKAEQIEHSTAADAPLPTTVDTTDHAAPTGDVTSPKEEPILQATKLARNTAGDFAEPSLSTPGSSLATPGEEKPNPLSSQGTPDEGKSLSQHTTASEGQASGPELSREDPDPKIDAIPVSQQTTASPEEDDAPSEPLERIPTQEPRTAPTLPEGEPGKASAEEV